LIGTPGVMSVPSITVVDATIFQVARERWSLRSSQASWPAPR
jgi:hypothetical protein